MTGPDFNRNIRRKGWFTIDLLGKKETMFGRNLLAALAVCAALVISPVSLRAQAAKGKLAGVTSLRCSFSMSSVSSWVNGQPKADAKAVKLDLQFEDINTDEGSAQVTQLKSGVGAYDIVVRYVPGYLHFIQSFRDGPLYVTTVLEVETSAGKLRAVHSRHEYTSFALPGFTSSPEQYYGECEILK